MDAVRILEDEIREIVRRQGIDPQREHARVLTLIQDAAADYESRAMVSSLLDTAGSAASWSARSAARWPSRARRAP